MTTPRIAAVTAAVAETTTATTTRTTTATTTVAAVARTSVSVRVRITATVALLVLAGLVVAGAVVYTIESRRLNQQIASQTDQEFAELATLQEGGRNPETNRPYESVGEMLKLFLQRKV